MAGGHLPIRVQVMEDVASAVALPVDFEESEDTYSFIADVPGLEKGDIKVCFCPGASLPTAAMG